MDVLSEILETVRLSSVVYFKSDFSAPWGMNIPSGSYSNFHLITRGQCTLMSKGQPRQLFAGDIVIFPHGGSHWIADSKESERKEGSEVVSSIVQGDPLFQGGSFSSTLVCGHFEVDKNLSHPLIAQLPDIVYISDEQKRELYWLEDIVNLIIRESDSERPGANVILSKLGEVLFVYALRAFLMNNSRDKGFLAALNDSRIAKALQAMHNSTHESWQLASLSQIAGMSRTAFSNRFRDLTGMTPLAYLKHWRIMKAGEMLKSGNKPVGEIAEEVGYRSEAAFNRVFKKQMQHTPLKFRNVKKNKNDV